MSGHGEVIFALSLRPSRLSCSRRTLLTRIGFNLAGSGGLFAASASPAHFSGDLYKAAVVQAEAEAAASGASLATARVAARQVQQAGYYKHKVALAFKGACTGTRVANRSCRVCCVTAQYYREAGGCVTVDVPTVTPHNCTATTGRA